ncbi:DUF1707 domain-containing protein, partial [Streptomyces sp. IBSBF 2507]|uniref:DUF1707 SHOCT-like domain-containing protein n=1 Tax=Streptomyces sp. IBSBF 2507 TaxID=2903530 RepID=UPI00351DDBD8
MDLHKHAPAAPRTTELRASDADRDRVADMLREALAEGRLTADEHAERVEGVLAAKTVGELDVFGVSVIKKLTIRPKLAGVVKG